MTNPEGPSILWPQLKGKKVKGNDGKEIGEVKEISQNYLRIEKGIMNKEKFWIPKFTVDAFDGKDLWLLAGGEDVLNRYAYGTEPAAEEFTRDFDNFRVSPYGQNAVFLPDFDQRVRLTEERNFNQYRNIREPEH